MTAKNSEVWLLATRPSGDTSLRATFLSREWGLIHCLCKGWRKNKKKSLMQPFAPLWLAVEERDGWYYARDIELTGTMQNLRGESLFAAHYINELLYYSLKPALLEPHLFEAYQACMQALAGIQERAELERILRQFEWQLLCCLGYGFSFSEEASSGAAIHEASCYQFVAAQGFFRAPQGLSGKALLALSKGDMSDVNTLKVAKEVMRQAISELLDGRVLKSRDLFKKA